MYTEARSGRQPCWCPFRLGELVRDANTGEPNTGTILLCYTELSYVDQSCAVLCWSCAMLSCAVLTRAVLYYFDLCHIDQCSAVLCWSCAVLIRAVSVLCWQGGSEGRAGAQDSCQTGSTGTRTAIGRSGPSLWRQLQNGKVTIDGSKRYRPNVESQHYIIKCIWFVNKPLNVGYFVF